jgi:hypothetical protein
VAVGAQMSVYKRARFSRLVGGRPCAVFLARTRALLARTQRIAALTFPCCALVLILGFAAAPRASADAGVVLNESLDTSVARITGSGHSAVYLSRVCPDNSPVKMRLCRPGEQGSVLSNYTTLGEDQPYEWNIVPLSIYLYGVEDPNNRPLVSSKEIKTALEERYRENYLIGLCTGKRCLTGSGSEWREMVGATLERSLYIFLVKTTVEQDEALIAEFNSLPNVNHFNGATRNCADFVRRVLNTYYPSAVKPDYLNDFLMTSPKAAARSFTRYAERHPELDLRVLHFAQVPGTIKRSSECRSGTEQLYHSKKLAVPLAVVAWQAVPAAAAFYMITAHFNPEHQFEDHASVDAPGTDDDSAAALRASATGYTVSVQQLEAEQRAGNTAIVGGKDEWQEYRRKFDALVDDAVRAELIPDRGYLKTVFKKLPEDGGLSLDADGALWIDQPASQGFGRVGVSASNIFAANTDGQIEYQIMLARMQAELDSPKHSRETMLEFKQDWQLLSNLRVRELIQIAQRRAATGSAAAADTNASQSSAPENRASFAHGGHETLP